MTSLELMAEEVQVWVASLDVKEDRYAALARLLPADERQRAASAQSRCCPQVRGRARNSPSAAVRFTGAPAEKLQFSYGLSGKPVMVDHDDIHFSNISHSAELGHLRVRPRSPGWCRRRERAASAATARCGAAIHVRR